MNTRRKPPSTTKTSTQSEIRPELKQAIRLRAWALDEVLSLTTTDSPRYNIRADAERPGRPAALRFTNAVGLDSVLGEGRSTLSTM
jgi:hypothetical protein